MDTPSIGTVTVAGFHAPHGGGPRGQADKEEAYRAVVAWLRTAPAPVVLGMDTNTWTTGVVAATELHPDADLLHQSSFQIPGRVHDLHDAFVAAAAANPGLHEEESWWTYDTGARRPRWDQIWVSNSITAVSAQVHADAPGVAPRKAHRPLTVTLRPKEG